MYATHPETIESVPSQTRTRCPLGVSPEDARLLLAVRDDLESGRIRKAVRFFGVTVRSGLDMNVWAHGDGIWTTGSSCIGGMMARRIARERGYRHPSGSTIRDMSADVMERSPALMPLLMCRGSTWCDREAITAKQAVAAVDRFLAGRDPWSAHLWNADPRAGT